MPARALLRRNLGGGNLETYKALIRDTSGALAYWPMQEASGAFAELVAGLTMSKVNAGDVTADLTYAQPGPLGGRSILHPLGNPLAGMATAQPTPIALGFNGTHAFTIELLGKYLPFNTSGAQAGALAQKSYAADGSDGLPPYRWQWEAVAFLDGTGWRLGLGRTDSTSSGESVVSGYITEPNTWRRYEFSYDGSNGRIYRDATLIAGPTAMGKSLTANDRPVSIGAINQGGGANSHTEPKGWNQCHTAIYDRVLTAPERAARMTVLGW